jgi:membrane protein YqaA with SNARE-associated domain
MLIGHALGVVLPTLARSLRRQLAHLGGLGLIPLGLLDNSLVPLPGIVDVAMIAMSAKQRQLWLYYALMATAGSVLGGFITYRLSRKGGKQALERMSHRKKMHKVTEIFGRWGFPAIAIPAVLPPPIPMVPFLLTAGALQYPIRKFLTALALGRAFRYLLLSYLAARYGRQIVAFVVAHPYPLSVGIILVLLVTSATVIYFWQVKKNKSWSLKLGRRNS